MYHSKRSKFDWKDVVFIAFLLLAASSAWYWYGRHGADQLSEHEAPAVVAPTLALTPSPTLEPEPSPAPELAPDPLFNGAEKATLPPPPRKARANELWLHVVKGQYKLLLYRGYKVERVYPVAVGANGGQKERVGDLRTPVGNFSVQQVQDSRKWEYDFGDGLGPIKGAYGPWFIRLRAAGWKGIGIHGTHDPNSVGTMITHGCVRLRNEDLEDLKTLVFPGMKVVISE